MNRLEAGLTLNKIGMLVTDEALNNIKGPLQQIEDELVRLYGLEEKVCKGCKYFGACGDEDRTVKCEGKECQ